MVDTGFDGGLLLPLEQYIGLGRQNFEEPGGTFVVRSASGLPRNAITFARLLRSILNGPIRPFSEMPTRVADRWPELQAAAATSRAVIGIAQRMSRNLTHSVALRLPRWFRSSPRAKS